jgi:hypothetical protein
MRRWKGSNAVNGNRLDPITLKAPDGNLGLVTYGLQDDRHRPPMGIRDGVARPGSTLNFLAYLNTKLGGRTALHGHYARLTM